MLAINDLLSLCRSPKNVINIIFKANEIPSWSLIKNMYRHAKKVVSDSLRLVDFAVRLEDTVLHLPTSGKFLRKFKTQMYCKKRNFGGLVRMTFGLVHNSYNLQISLKIGT